MVGHENAHLLPSKVIPAVHIGCGVKSCGSGIDQYRALCALCEIELLSPHRRSLLCLWKDHTGRISCCCHWFLASPLRLHFLLDVSLTCSMYLFVLVLGVCAHPSQVESVHVQILRLLFVPFEGGVCVCVCACKQSVSCSGCAVKMTARLACACQPAACDALAGRPSSSPLLYQLTSSPSACTQKSYF